jgi:hypothetical protein
MTKERDGNIYMDVSSGGLGVRIYWVNNPGSHGNP